MAETAKIRVNVEVVTLEVNDNGDTVTLPVGDERFIKRLYSFADNIGKKAEEMQKVESEDITTMIDSNVEFHEFLHDEFNQLFGDKSYEKTFGEGMIVGAEYVLEFIEQVMPYVKKYTIKRVDKLNKYNADRVGSSL